MPDRHSTPATPRATHAATKSSQFSPACTVTRPWPVASTPRDNTWTTVPGKPASATTRFEPPARTSTGGSASRTAAAIAASSRASTKRAAGPPRRSVVSSARRRVIAQEGTGAASNPDCELRRRIAAHPRLLGAPLLVVALLAGAFLLLRDSSVVRVDRVTVVGASGPE